MAYRRGRRKSFSRRRSNSKFSKARRSKNMRIGWRM